VIKIVREGVEEKRKYLLKTVGHASQLGVRAIQE
jgi:hypothetical protein